MEVRLPALHISAAMHEMAPIRCEHRRFDGRIGLLNCRADAHAALAAHRHRDAEHFAGEHDLMTATARSIQVFGVYLLLPGATLVAAPNLLLGVFGFPPTDGVWIRVVGMLAGILGVYDLRAAHAGQTAFFGWTVPVRLAVPVFFAAFVALGMAPAALLLLGAVDAAGALWTRSALRRG